MRLRPSARRGGRLARLALAAALLGLPMAAPGPAAGVGPLPECRLDDILTEPRGYDDWAVTLVDWILTLGKDYVPPDLVSVREGGVAGGGYVRAVAIDDLRAMARAAAANGTPLVAWSPYRSYGQQKRLFRSYVRGYGFDEAIKFSARPGHSEHQLGLTIDFVAVGDTGLTSNWEVTPTGRWMAQNAWKYGWLMSYPKGKKKLTCYTYEPWHYRYVGRELAKQIHDAGVTPREYLWANFTQAEVPTEEPSPGASTPAETAASTPAATPPPSAAASPDASPEATDGPAASAPGAPTAPGMTPTPAPGPGDAGDFLASAGPAMLAGVAAALAVVLLLAARAFRRGTGR